MNIEEARKYKSWIFPRKLILPVKAAKYLGVDIYRPEKIEGYLEYVYGLDYMTPYDRDNNGGNKEPVNRLMRQMVKSTNEDFGLAPILIVNLDNDKERLHHLFKQCEEEGLYAKKIGNCCERLLTDKENNRFTFNSYNKEYLRAEEKKCFLSHEMCWKEASKQILPSLIVEDDIALPFESKHILSCITRDLNHIIISGIAPAATTLRLGYTNNNKKYIQQLLGGTCLMPGLFNTGSWAYIVTPEAAKLLLNFSAMNALSWPVDHVINPPYERQSTRNYETRIPPPDRYMFLEVCEEVFSPLKRRYNLGKDKYRHQIIQELSTDLNSSRSDVNKFLSW